MTAASLADVNAGRDNNFNLLRFVASLSVVITHAVALSAGMVGTSALHVFGGYVAILAPDVFFVASGYLISASLLTRNDAVEFLRARVVRIYPALWVVVLTTVFVIGPALSTQPLAAYFGDSRTWLYLLRNLTVLFGVAEGLPGLFAGLPLPDAVNGSLWTLPVEIRLYLALLLLWWLAGRFTGRREFWIGVVVVVGAVILGSLKLWLQPRWGAQPINTLRLAPLFLIGCSMYLWRSYIPMRRDLFGVALGAMLITLPWREVFFVVEFFAIGYVTLYLAYVPGGRVRAFNRYGDCSYGVYIVSFPLQQSMVALMPGIGPWAMIGWSLLVTVPVAMLSWHFVEKPALAMKRRLPSTGRAAAGAT
jgi:peptidoglycan/LPS O-acetylase OafA/YrhL